MCFFRVENKHRTKTVVFPVFLEEIKKYMEILYTSQNYTFMNKNNPHERLASKFSYAFLFYDRLLIRTLQKTM